MAFLKTNYRKAQFWGQMRVSIQIDSAGTHVFTFSTSNYPPPSHADAAMVFLASLHDTYIDIRTSVQGAYIYASLQPLTASLASMGATVTYIFEYIFLVGSR